MSDDDTVSVALYMASKDVHIIRDLTPARADTLRNRWENVAERKTSPVVQQFRTDENTVLYVNLGQVEAFLVQVDE